MAVIMVAKPGRMPAGLVKVSGHFGQHNHRNGLCGVTQGGSDCDSCCTFCIHSYYKFIVITEKEDGLMDSINKRSYGQKLKNI